MLESIHVTNFRSLADVRVSFDQFTVVIGANASGKTNLVDALSLISDGLSDELETAVLSREGRDAALVRRRQPDVRAQPRLSTIGANS